ncbi:MAG: DoxX family protein [Robiginitomaculum sp.]|nr:DoxX family protein [Robiginitomaculum sp.]
MTHTGTNIWLIMGRSLLALYFFVPGIAKLLSPDMQLTLMVHHNIPFSIPLLYIAGIAQVIGAIFLMTNRHVRKTAFGYVLYILIINYTLHDFWHFEGIEAAHELQNFIKNLGILAGLLVLAGISPKRSLLPLKLKTLFQSDNS